MRPVEAAVRSGLRLQAAVRIEEAVRPLHVAKSGGMPSFKGQLKDDQIAAVVTYERTGLQ